MRGSRWLIFAPVAILALFSSVTNAEADALGDWTYSQSATCGGSVEVTNNIITLHGSDQNGCSGQAHWVKIETTIPANVDTIDFTWSYQTNDGWVYDPPQYGVNGVYTLLTQQNNATGSLSVPVNQGDVFTFRQYSIDTCCAPGHLSISNLSLWEFTTTTTTEVSTTTIAESTTSSEVSTTTIAVTTTVEPTTSLAPTTTLLPVEPTMPEQSTTSSTTTTSTVLATTTTTEYISPPVAQPPATVEPPPTTQPTTTSTEPTPPETEPSPPETAPQPPETAEATIPPVDDTSPPDAPQAPETLPILDTVPPPPDTVPAPPADTTPAEEPLTEAEFEAVIEQLAEATEEQIVAIIDDLITKDLDTSQAAAFVSSPAVLAAITTDQAEALFGEISTAELSEVEAEQVVAAVQDAPPSVRQAFESVLNIFSGFADNYVPFDSRIPVSERRALVALGAVLLAASPAPTLRRRQ